MVQVIQTLLETLKGEELVRNCPTVGLDVTLWTIQLPAGVAHVHSGLADMNADAITHFPEFQLMFSKNRIKQSCDTNTIVDTQSCDRNMFVDMPQTHSITATNHCKNGIRSAT